MADGSQGATRSESDDVRRRRELARRRLDAATDHASHEPRTSAEYEREVPPHHG